MTALLVALLLSVASVADAGRLQVRTLEMITDSCGGICEFSICVDGERRPDVRLCPRAEADVTMLVPMPLAPPSPLWPRRATTLLLNGTRVRLLCRETFLLAPCQTRCEMKGTRFERSKCVGRAGGSRSLLLPQSPLRSRDHEEHSAVSSVALNAPVRDV